MSKQARDDRGAQAVEFALLFTFVVAPLLYGIIGVGFALHQKITVSELAREAVRIQAICLSSSGVSCATTAQARALAIYGGPTPTFTWGSTTCNSTSGYTADVTVTVTVGAELPMPGFVPLSTVSGTATAPCGG
jgi:Flp pilus assembly protein TadG